MRYILIVVSLFILSIASLSAEAARKQNHSRNTQHRTLKSPFASWIGKKFIILTNIGEHDYESFTVTKIHGVNTKQFGTNDEIFFHKFVGKVITCVKVGAVSVTFKVPDYNIEITYSLVSYTDGHRDADLSTTVEPLAPITELDTIKEAYLGKTVWACNRADHDVYYNLFYYDNLKKCLLDKLTKYQGIDLPRGTKLTVTDVRWGNNWFRPVWLVVRDNDDRYYCYEVAADPTNKLLRSDDVLIRTANERLAKTEPTTEPVENDSTETIASFSGETQQETDSFIIPAGHTGYVVWTASTGSLGDGNFAATLKKVNDNSEVQMVTNVIGSHSGTTNCYHHGTFYFDVLATEDWTIKVYLR